MCWIFIVNWCWILLSAFSASVEDVVFLLEMVNVMDCIDWFSNIEPALHSWEKPQLVMVYILFMHFVVVPYFPFSVQGPVEVFSPSFLILVIVSSVLFCQSYKRFINFICYFQELAFGFIDFLHGFIVLTLSILSIPPLISSFFCLFSGGGVSIILLLFF